MATTAPRAARRLLPAAVVLLTAVLGVLAGASPAAAHSSLTGSDPEQGAVVESAPGTVSLTFSERVTVGDDSVRVLDPEGDRTDTGEARDLSGGDGVRYGVDLRPGIPDGTYTVAWQAVSADSHPISGAFTFSVGAPSETSVSLPRQQSGGGPVGIAYGTARFCAYAGFVLLAGGAAFVLVAWRGGAAVRPVQRLITAGWLVLAAATVAMLLLRHPYTTGGSLAAAFDPAGLRDVVETRTGTALVSRLLLLAVAAMFVAVLFGSFTREREERERRDLHFGLALGGAVVATGLAATWAMAEHASSGAQTSVAVPVAVLHLLAVACWLGGLAALLTGLYAGGNRADVPAGAVRRFSALALGSVLVLVGTGVYQSWRQVGGWSALTATGYGRLLLAKLVLLAVLLAAAWYSRRWAGRLREAPGRKPDSAERPENTERPEHGDTSPRPAAGPAGTTTATEPLSAERRAQLARQAAALATARRRRERDSDPERGGLRRSVLAEAVIAAVLLAVTTVLTGTEPARTEAARQNAGAAVPGGPVSLSVPFDTGGPDGKGTVRFDLDPGRTGDNTLRLRTDVDAEEVKVTFTLPERDLGPLTFAPEPYGSGREAKRRFRAEGVQLPMPGDWETAVTVRTSEVDQVTETKNMRIG